MILWKGAFSLFPVGENRVKLSCWPGKVSDGPAPHMGSALQGIVAAEVRGQEQPPQGEQAGIQAPAAAAPSWLSTCCVLRGLWSFVCLSPRSALTPPQLLVEWLDRWWISELLCYQKLAVCNFLNMKHFARYSVFPALVPRCLAPTLRCVLQQLGLSRAGRGIMFTVTACLSSNSAWRFIGVCTYLLTNLFTELRQKGSLHQHIFEGLRRR